MWDPTAYLRYTDERGRPFFELLARVQAPNPSVVVDLGCGPGTLTAELAEVWPGAKIVGVDSSPEMIDRARSLGTGIDFQVGDVRDWAPDPDVAVVVSNATLQWVDGHLDLLVRWARDLAPGGWLAMQVPGNFDAPSHRALREVASLGPWRSRLADGLRRPGDVLDPAEYAALLRPYCDHLDVWETTYVHLLEKSPGRHPVLRWMEGTALRPVRAALRDDEWERFCDELEARLESAYAADGGVVAFPFRRVFVVARRSPRVGGRG